LDEQDVLQHELRQLEKFHKVWIHVHLIGFNVAECDVAACRGV
jgi:hypothetical protein